LKTNLEKTKNEKMGDEEAKPYSWLSLEPLQEGQVRYKILFFTDSFLCQF
jgi:hypothetical protein